MDSIRATFDAFNRRDWDTVLALTDPDVEWRTDPNAPDAGVYRGHEALLALVRDDWAQTFDDLRVELEKVIDLGEDRFLTVARMEGRIRGSESGVDQRFADLMTLRDGKLWRIRDYPDEAAAREAASAHGP
jgi:ketosteroid isomerase-like protein